MAVRRVFWTPKEETELRDWLKKGKGDRDAICKSLNRNWHSVAGHIGILGLKAPALPHASTYVSSKGSSKGSKEESLEIARLQAQIQDLTERKRISIHNFYDQKIKVGLIGDSQMGSLYERIDILEAAYDAYEKEGITSVYHTGDLLDGEEMYRGQVYEISIHGADAQVKHCVKEYPYRKNITTYFILGNHDLSYWKRSGIDIGERVASGRGDMIYLGKEEADIQMTMGDRKVLMRLSHPGKGTSYAISYQPQKYIESLAGGQKPHVVAMGHYHKAEMLPCERNIFLIQSGCTQSQTPHMRRNNLAAHLGFWTLEFTINPDNLVSRFKAEFFAIYEERKISTNI